MKARHLAVTSLSALIAACSADAPPAEDMAGDVALDAPTAAPGNASVEDAAATTQTVRQGWLSVRRTGAGPDVVLVPGLASSASVWDATVEMLEDTHTLHVVQVDGFGGAPANAETRDALLSGLAEDLAAYIEGQGLDAPTLVGHSMGGFTALHVARDHPERVGRVVSVDSLPFYPLIFDPSATAESAAPQAVAMTARMRNMPKDIYDGAQAQTASILSNRPDAQARIAADARASDRDVAMDALYELMTTDLRPDLGRISVPVTVIYAHDDRMGVPAEALDGLYETAYAGLPDARLTRIDNSFHFIMDDQPEAFASALASALTR
jgi:pimeloyl-ACP methyl ester carboxylesterase